MENTNTPKKMINVLSFDGGGSRGIMEAMVLDDFMRLVTVMKEDPNADLIKMLRSKDKFEFVSLLHPLIKRNEDNLSLLQGACSNEFQSRNEFQWLGESLFGIYQSIHHWKWPVSHDEREEDHDEPPKKVPNLIHPTETVKDLDLIHPTEIFDMIAGTSTGSLIAFGLVAGKKIGRSREPMTVQDIIDLYRKGTKNIFVKKKTGFFGTKDSKVRRIPGIPRLYSQDGLKKELEEVFGDTTLDDINRASPGCIAAAVAMEFNENTKQPDTLEIFDSKNENQHYLEARNVMLASSDAPVYFETPTKVGQKFYIDGGVTGNCPLIKALPRVLNIYEKDSPVLQSVISIAPPSKDIAKKKGDSVKYWLDYFPSKLTDGFKVYAESRIQYPKTTFVRAKPVSQDAEKFKMDETNVKAMEDTMKKERLEEELYYDNILDMAALTVSRLDPAFTQTFLEMMEAITEDIVKKKNFDIGIKVAENILNKINTAKIEGVEKDWFASHFHSIVGDCKEGLAQWEEAEQSYQKGIETIKKNKGFREQIRKIALTRRIGDLKDETGKYQQSLELYEMALEMVQNLDTKVDGYNEYQHKIEECHVLNNKGGLLQKWGYRENKVEEFDEAIEIYELAFDLLESLREKYKDEGQVKEIKEYISAVQNDLGISYLYKEEYEKALEHFNPSLKMYEEVFGKNIDRPDIATTLNNVALCYQNQGQYKDAIEKYKKSLEMKKSWNAGKEIITGCGGSASIATALFNLGDCERLAENYKEAWTFANEAYNLKLQIYGKSHVDVADSLNLIALILLDQEKWEQAKKKFGEARAIASPIEGGEKLLRRIEDSLKILEERQKKSRR